jgi:multidrug transporter EmrE-like cation transporter
MGFLAGALLLTASGQLSLKAGTSKSRRLLVIAGLASLGTAMVSTMFALQQLEIGFVFMATGLTHVLVLLGSRWLLAEDIPGDRWVGVAIIIAGVVLSGIASL